MNPVTKPSTQLERGLGIEDGAINGNHAKRRVADQDVKLSTVHLEGNGGGRLSTYSTIVCPKGCTTRSIYNGELKIADSLIVLPHDLHPSLIVKGYQDISLGCHGGQAYNE